MIREEKKYNRKLSQYKTMEFTETEVSTPCEATPQIIDPKMFERENFLKSSATRHDSYKVDFDTFKMLFSELLPWGTCQNVDLADKLFRVSPS